MKKIILIGSVILAFLCNAEHLLALIDRLLNLHNMDNSWHTVLDIIGILAKFFAAYYLLTKMNDLREELKLHVIINRVRDIATFQEIYKEVDFYFLPNETLEQFLNRSKQGIYNRIENCPMRLKQ